LGTNWLGILMTSKSLSTWDGPKKIGWMMKTDILIPSLDHQIRIFHVTKRLKKDFVKITWSWKFSNNLNSSRSSREWVFFASTKSISSSEYTLKETLSQFQSSVSLRLFLKTTWKR
jgi:hypothetical protein